MTLQQNVRNKFQECLCYRWPSYYDHHRLMCTRDVGATHAHPHNDIEDLTILIYVYAMHAIRPLSTYQTLCEH